MSSRARTSPTLWVGPIAFAGVMVCVVGLFNLLTGVTAVFSDEVYLSAPGAVLVLDVTAWGWVHLLAGLFLLISGIALLAGQVWARGVVVALAALNMVSQLILLPAYPFWAVVTIALDVIVVWAVLVHGDEISDSTP